MSVRRKNKPVTVRGREFVITDPRGRVSLAYRGMKDLSVEIFARPQAVKILDLSHNDLVYPNSYVP